MPARSQSSPDNNAHNYKSVFFIIGVLLAALGAGMLLPAFVGLINGELSSGFFIAAAFTGFVAGGLILTNRGKHPPLGARHAFLLTALSWVALAAFAALPLRLALELNYTDAFFEAMSGLTTTGATILSGLDDAPRNVLLWRALLQWFGGIGIIVTAIAVLPMLNVGGMQLFRLESSDTSEKILPRTTQLAGSISRLYFGISCACAAAYYFSGMGGFDAITHAMTTIATGGFSTHDASFAAFNSAQIEWVAVLFMLVASLPFVAYLQMTNAFATKNATKNINVKSILDDSQIVGFLTLALGAVITLSIYQTLTSETDILTALRLAAFNGISILTGTGYVSTNYSDWGGFAILAFFVLSFIGGCAGSTSCGLKIFRVQILLKSGWRYVRQLSFPNGVFIIRYNRRIIDERTAASIIAFVFIFFITFILVAMVLSLLGLDMLTSLSAAAAAVANVGPGLGAVVGPAGNYASLPDTAKWVLAAAMLLGRLEFLTILVVLTPSFWRR